MLYGSEEPISYTLKSSSGNISKRTDYIEGVLSMIKRRHLETNSEMSREFYSKYMVEKKCKICNGKKLSAAALSIKINGLDIIDVTQLSIGDCINFFLNLKLTDKQKQIAELALKEILER
jgi:excinuclease ABC subunit A